MASKPKEAPTPVPQAQAVSVDDEAKRRAELERRKRGGYYSEFRKHDSANQQVGGATETLG
jgi:hypothetical protein